MATNEVKTRQGTAITFRGTGGTVAFTFQNVASGAGRISAQADLGSGDRPSTYKLRITTKAGAALAYGANLDVYLKTSDGTISDGTPLGTADAAIATSASKLNNCIVIGSVIADSTTNGDVQSRSWPVVILDRYVQVAIWNNLGQTLTNTEADHIVELIPYVDVIEAAA